MSKTEMSNRDRHKKRLVREGDERQTLVIMRKTSNYEVRLRKSEKQQDRQIQPCTTG